MIPVMAADQRPAMWRDVVRLGRLFPLPVAALSAAILLDSGCRTLLPLMYGRLVDGVNSRLPMAGVVRYGAIAVGLTVLGFVTSTVSRYMSIRVGQQISNVIRNRLFATLQTMPLDAVEKCQGGEVLNHFNAETAQTQSLVTSTLPQVLALIGTTVSVAGVARGMNWIVIAMSAVALPVTLAWTALFMRPMASMSGRQLDLMADANDFVLERSASLGAITSRASSDRQEEGRQYAEASSEVASAVTRFGLLNAVNSCGLTSLSGGLVAFVYVAGAFAASRGTISVGQVVTAATLVPVILGPLTSVADLRTATMASRVALGRLLAFEPALLTSSDPGPRAARSGPGAAVQKLTMADVHVRRGGRDVLADVTATLEPGRINILTGPAGGGKTSLLRCLAGIDDPARGSIRLHAQGSGNPEARVVTQYVPQEPHFFTGTVLSNFRLAAPRCTAGQVWTACRMAGVEKTVASWAEGLDQELGEHGSLLSGGQRAKLALARALVADPAFLLLDEPLAHLDPASRGDYVRTLEELAKDRLVVVASHQEDFETARHRKFLVEDGQLRAVTPEEMLVS